MQIRSAEREQVERRIIPQDARGGRQRQVTMGGALVPRNYARSATCAGQLFEQEEARHPALDPGGRTNPHPSPSRRFVCHALKHLDYLANTVAHLDQLGITDGPLHGLLEHVRRPA